MSEYRGDFTLGSNVDIKFSTRKFSTGAPFTLAGAPIISAYPDNSLTEITAGITLTVDFDGRTGLNHVRVVASGGNGYASGSSYDLVITTGTVDGISVVGEVIGSFSIEARSSAAIKTDTAAIKAKTDNLPADPADASDIAARTLPAANYATAAAQTTLQAGIDDIPTNAELATSQAAADDATLAAIAALNNLSQADVRAAVGLASANLDTQLDALPTNAELVTALDAIPTATEIADVYLDRDMAAGPDTGSATKRTPRQGLRFLRNKWGPDGSGNISVKKEDDVTESWKFVPTTTTGADPITAVDPEGP